MFVLFLEEKLKFEKLPFVCDQPEERHDIYASLVEENSCLVAREREWETEWNKTGIMSRLSEQVCQTERFVFSLSSVRQKRNIEF